MLGRDIDAETAVRYGIGQIGPPDGMFLTQEAVWREAGVLRFRVA